MRAVSATGICDTITVELHSTASPYGLVYSLRPILSVSGTTSSSLPGNSWGNSYFVVVKHRNTLETWSSSPVAISLNTSYDFSTATSKAFGNREVSLGDGNFALYSGDLNQDGSIDLSDISVMESALNQSLGDYQVSDLSGDQLTETADYCLLENNFSLGISVSHP